MHLQLLDWIIIVVSLLICFVPALFFGKRGGKNTAEFFASGRSVPWWLAGLSMVATTFSSDTPNWVTEQVRKFGVAGNWQWWAFVLTGVATVFFFARLWRRSGVMTDLEFYEARYSGKAASVVRGFRAIYLGLFYNCFIMGMVTLAGCKIANILFAIPPWQTIVFCGIMNVAFASHSGLWGVLVIDMVQFFIKMTAVVAAAYFSLKAVALHTGVGESAMAGLNHLVSNLGALQVITPDKGEPIMSAIDGKGQPILDILPNFSMDLALMIFIMPIAIGWWANWYPGAEPGGGSYIAQRMLASKSEKDSLGGTLFFNLAHYVLRPWPWIITALCSIIIYPDLASIKAAFPNADPTLIGHDSAFPAMLKFLPVGFVGLMVGGLIAASSSTILTHLNWGSSYLVHDFYRRFVRADSDEKHYVNVGRLCTVGLYIVAALLSTQMSSAQQAFEILLSIGAGTGLLYIVRWLWWRVTAWCEVTAMASSMIVSAALIVCNSPRGMTHGGLIFSAIGAGILVISKALSKRNGDEPTFNHIVATVIPFAPFLVLLLKVYGFEDGGMLCFAFLAVYLAVNAVFSLRASSASVSAQSAITLIGHLISVAGFIMVTLAIVGPKGESLVADAGFASKTIFTVAVTTACWLIAAFLGPQTERSKLIEFYRKVHPAGPGWTKVRMEAGVTESEAALHGDHMGMATVGWVSGCVVIWSSLFAIGKFLYGQTQAAWILTGVFVVSGAVLLYVVNHLWDSKEKKR